MKTSQFDIDEFIQSTLSNKYHEYLFKKFESDKNCKRFFEMCLIRAFENKLLECFSKGQISGTTHTYLGQECNSVAIFENINPTQDIIWSNHRCHGHFISYCGKIYELMAEIFGKKEGICGGRGGSQHLHYKNFYSNGILGGSVPQAVGASFAKKETNSITLVFIGDGTMGEGVVYESLNIASLLNCPILFICENNFIAQTTAIENNLAGTIEGRIKGFNVKFDKCSNYDFDEIIEKSKKMIDYVRSKKKPAFLEINSIRLGPHSKGDDTRNNEILDDIIKNDVLLKIKNKIKYSLEIEELTTEIINKVYLKIIN